MTAGDLEGRDRRGAAGVDALRDDELRGILKRILRRAMVALDGGAA